MTRKDFIKIIRLRSSWKIDKKRGNYTLPDGSRLSSYINQLIMGQLMIDSIAPSENGDLNPCHNIDPSKALEKDICGLPIYHIVVPFGNDETCDFDEMERRIKKLVNSVIYE